MKRPGWLGGKGAGEDEPRSGDDAEPEDSEAGAEDPKSESAAERSARRVAAKQKRGAAGGGSSRDARRRLAARVGRASGAAKDDEPGDDEPAKPTAKQPAAGKKPEKKSEEKEPAKSEEKVPAKPGKKLHRPRRQSEREHDIGDESGDEAKRGERKPSEKGRARGEAAKEKPARRRSAKQPSAGKRARAGAASFAAALKRGAIETKKWGATNGPKAGRALLVALGAVFALFFEVVGFVLNVLIAVGRLVAGPVGAVLRALGRAARAGSRLLTPTRALAIVVAGAAILLALSQYADYRSISIGNSAYSEVQTLAPAPETGRLPTGDAHSYVFVPVAIACLLLLGVATIGRRWRACRLIALAGFAAIVVALIVDRPAGLDPGDAAVSFEGVKATLVGGFYAQIAAGLLLIGSSTLLARELRLAGATRRATTTGAEDKAARERRPRRRAPGAGGTARA